jgi:hypothetical protein
MWSLRGAAVMLWFLAKYNEMNEIEEAAMALFELYRQ